MISIWNKKDSENLENIAHSLEGIAKALTKLADVEFLPIEEIREKSEIAVFGGPSFTPDNELAEGAIKRRLEEISRAEDAPFFAEDGLTLEELEQT